MITAIFIIVVLLVAVFDEYDKVLSVITTIFFGLLLAIPVTGALGMLSNNVISNVPVTVVAESATEIVFDGPDGLESVNRSDLVYKDNCDGYHFAQENVDRWVLGFSIPWDSYYVSCEAHD